MQPGDGVTYPQKGDAVTLHYEGFFSDGQKFDSSLSSGTPLTFTSMAGEVIPGWDEGIASMSLGEIAKIFIPAAKAFGAKGNMEFGGNIPPNKDLIYEVELLKVGNKHSPKLKQSNNSACPIC